MGNHVFIVTASSTVQKNFGEQTYIATATAVDVVLTLPTSAPGIKGHVVRVIQDGTSASVGLKIKPASTDLIHGNGITAAAGKSLINTHGTETNGDAVSLVADGAGAWFLLSKTGTWAREA